jgi:hypothetical protein
MRHSCGVAWAVVVGLVWAGVVRADDADKARAIIDKAIKAMGGAKKLGKNKAVTWNEEGTYYGMGEGLPYKGSYASAGPDRFRMDIQGVFIIVLDGDKGWVKEGGKTRAMNKQELAQQQTDRRAASTLALIPLKDKAFQLEDLGEVKVDKKPALAIKVTREGYPDLKLYIDKKTNLLLKLAYRNKAPEQTFKEVDQEYILQDYQAVDGVQVPEKVVLKRDGKLFVEAKIKDWKFKDKLDDKLFEKP